VKARDNYGNRGIELIYLAAFPNPLGAATTEGGHCLRGTREPSLGLSSLQNIAWKSFKLENF